MQCPKCGIEMDEVRKIDVIVDSCSRCGGIWLDRGELDKLRSTAQEIRQDSGYAAQPPAFSKYPDAHRDSDHHHDSDDHGKSKKKKSALDLLDFFG